MTTAAPARRATDPASPAQADTDQHLHRLCEAWADWCRAANRQDPPRRRATDANAPGVLDVMAFHLAVTGQPATALDRQVFELHYLQGSRHIKAEAARLGISRPHWYRLVGDFRRRVFDAMRRIQRQNSAWKISADETSFCLTD